MADVTLTYKGSDILELSNSGSATLKTGGTYCEADIEVEYVKPSGGEEIDTPDFYIYELVDGSYVDRTQDRVSYAPIQKLIRNGNGSYPNEPIKNIYGDDFSYCSAAWLVNNLTTAGAGANANLICEGNKVYSYNGMHIGFSSNTVLNGKNDGTTKNLAPTAITATGPTPNYKAKCKGYTVAQTTMVVQNPTNDDIVINSVYISSPSQSSAPIDSDTVTGNEHCI